MITFALMLFNWFIVKNLIFKLLLAIILIVVAEIYRKKKGSNIFIILGEMGSIITAIIVIVQFVLLFMLRK